MTSKKPHQPGCLVHAAQMIHDGLNAADACEATLVDSLTDDLVIRDALLEIVHAYFAKE